ncbi:MAG: hypothetical protein WCD83_17415 [Pseudolabrys sp.]
MMVVATAFLVLERIAPGRELPHAPGWYGRAILINLAPVAITFATNRLWLDLLSGLSLFHLARLESSVLQGFIGWLVGTFFSTGGIASAIFRASGLSSTRSTILGTHRGFDRLL